MLTCGGGGRHVATINRPLDEKSDVEGQLGVKRHEATAATEAVAWSAYVEEVVAVETDGSITSVYWLIDRLHADKVSNMVSQSVSNSVSL